MNMPGLLPVPRVEEEPIGADHHHGWHGVRFGMMLTLPSWAPAGNVLSAVCPRSMPPATCHECRFGSSGSIQGLDVHGHSSSDPWNKLSIDAPVPKLRHVVAVAPPAWDRPGSSGAMTRCAGAVAGRDRIRGRRSAPRRSRGATSMGPSGLQQAAAHDADSLDTCPVGRRARQGDPAGAMRSRAEVDSRCSVCFPGATANVRSGSPEDETLHVPALRPAQSIW